MRFSREWFRNRQVVVLGLAKSGLAAAKLLRQLGAHVTVNDRQPEDQIAESDKQQLAEWGVRTVFGGHPEGLITSEVDLVVKNPGIPYEVTPIQEALRHGVPVVTEVELGWQWTSSPIIAITGSNGKTTTTTLIGEMLREAGRQVHVVGNIGQVMSEVAFSSRPDETLVVELSSFQLMGTVEFRPAIGVLTNVYPAHLDYHGTMDAYVAAKCRLFANQQATDAAVLNADQDISRQVARTLRSRIFWFSLQGPVSVGVFMEGEYIFWKPAEGERVPLFRRDEVALKGDHNLANLLAAATAALLDGVSVEAVRNVARSFVGVEHRLEFVREVGGVAYYNDSKATNATAAMTALRSFREGVTWIAGGLDRGVSFDEMIPTVQRHVRRVIAYGQTRELIVDMCRRAGVTDCFMAVDVEDAVRLARRLTPAGEVVLLSPACASWDMYRSFEERGHIFKQAVHKL